jgi:hypothetical protein
MDEMGGGVGVGASLGEAETPEFTAEQVDMNDEERTEAGGECLQPQPGQVHRYHSSSGSQLTPFFSRPFSSLDKFTQAEGGQLNVVAAKVWSQQKMLIRRRSSPRDPRLRRTSMNDGATCHLQL